MNMYTSTTFLVCVLITYTPDSGLGDCPREAVLFELPGWDACMTWRLEDGRTVLQNFVMSAEDCTTARLVYWENYIQRVWKTAGWAECCFENECNSMGRKIAPPTPNNTVSPMNGAAIYPLNQFINNRPPEVSFTE